MHQLQLFTQNGKIYTYLKSVSKPMKYTVKDLRVDFPDEQACLEWLVNYLYPDGIFCIQCDKLTKHYPITGRKVYSCGKCGWHVSPTANTIFHKSRTPLTDWFHAIYLMSTNKAGCSAKQIERELGVTYKTAWRMMHQIRTMMTAPEDELLHGEVEVDEMYWHPNTFKRSSARMAYGYDARRTGAVILGMLQRGGTVKVFQLPATTWKNIKPLIREHVAFNTLVHTDGYRPYRKYLPAEGYEHRWTNHTEHEYYRPDSYTQNIEGFWSTAKPRIKGTFKHISHKYLLNYMNEYAWRYNHRKDVSMFWSLMGEVDK